MEPSASSPFSSHLPNNGNSSALRNSQCEHCAIKQRASRIEIDTTPLRDISRTDDNVLIINVATRMTAIHEMNDPKYRSKRWSVREDSDDRNYTVYCIHPMDSYFELSHLQSIKNCDPTRVSNVWVEPNLDEGTIYLCACISFGGSNVVVGIQEVIMYKSVTYPPPHHQATSYLDPSSSPSRRDDESNKSYQDRHR